MHLYWDPNAQKCITNGTLVVLDRVTTIEVPVGSARVPLEVLFWALGSY